MADPRTSTAASQVAMAATADADPGAGNEVQPALEVPPGRGSGDARPHRASGDFRADEGSQPPAGPPAAMLGLIMLGAESAPTCADGVCQ